MTQLGTGTAAHLRRLAALTAGEVRLVLADLPGRAVVGAVRQEGTLWVILDVTKPDPYDHLARLIETWPLECPRAATASSVVNPTSRRTPLPVQRDRRSYGAG